MTLDRRRVLSGVATALAAGLAGCAGSVPLLEDDREWKLRAMRTAPDSTDRVCDLGDEFVDAHPHLQTVLDRADETPRREWCDPVFLTVESGNDLGSDLSQHCGEAFRSSYRYQGTYYFVSLVDRFPENDQGHGGGHHDDGHDHAH